jgi:hypothetical protein
VTLPKPVAYWSMSSVGGAMIDSAGTLDGAYVGSPASVPGAVGQAIEFNVGAGGQYVLVADEPALDSATKVAFSAWIRPSITLNSGAGTRVVAMRLGAFTLRYSSGALQFQIVDLSNQFTTLSHTTTLAANTWHHVAGAYDVADQMRLYLNGVEVASVAGPGSIQTGNGALYVGRASNATGEFIGAIDEASFFKQTLAGADVAALHAAGVAQTSVTDCGTCVQPAAHYELEDNPDPTVADDSGTNPGINQSGSVPAPGVAGMGLRFVDVPDYVSIPNTLALNLTASLSIALWVRPVATLGNSAPLTPFFDSHQGDTGFGLFMGASQDLRFAIGSTQAKVLGTTLSAGTWYHLAGTWDGTNLTLYLNGAAVGANTRLTPLTAYTADSSIGGDGGPLFGTFDGTVDEVVLYDVELSSAQVAEIHALGLAGTPLPN